MCGDTGSFDREFNLMHDIAVSKKQHDNLTKNEEYLYQVLKIRIDEQDRIQNKLKLLEKNLTSLKNNLDVQINTTELLLESVKDQIISYEQTHHWIQETLKSR